MRGAQVHTAREGLTIRPRVLKLSLSWLTKLTPGLANTQFTPGQPSLMWWPGSLRLCLTGLVRPQCANVSTTHRPAVHNAVPISYSALVNPLYRPRGIEWSPWRCTHSLNCRRAPIAAAKRKARLCGMNGLQKQCSVRACYFKREKDCSVRC